MAQSSILNPQSPRISIIVAYAANRVIGKDGKMPWHLSEDLKRFRQLTMGHHIIMGRKTWESISRLLPGRKHIIISRNPGYNVPGAKVVDSLDAAIAAARGDSEIFVIGGREIYAMVLPIADRILVTEIDREYEGDTFFPPFDLGKWVEVSREKGTKLGSLPHDFVIYERAAVCR
jgi:dihydrofolate reductase